MNDINISRDRFLVFGAGVSGRSALKLLWALGATASIIEGNGPEDISSYDVMILSPGIPRTHRLVELFLTQSKLVIGELEFASRYIKSPIICVTGSNGKTTVCTMMAKFLEQLGKRFLLGGNIGTPLSEAALAQINGEEFDYIICEASSFQLESLASFEVKVGALINLSFTHQERYQSFRQYAQAKLNLLAHSETFLYTQHELIEPSLGKSSCKRQEFKETYQFGYEFMQLVGEHNKKNFEYCFQILQAAGVEFSTKQAQYFIEHFEAPAFRIQKVAVVKNLIFYNDSKSTNLESTLAAIDCFHEKNLILILGGKVRDSKLSHFKEIDKISIDSLYSFGEASRFLDKEVTSLYSYGSLDEIFIALGLRIFDPDKVYHVLFSPGFPSFDQYRNYLERGEHFNRLVAKHISL